MGCRGSRFKAHGHATARPCSLHSPTEDTRTHTNTDSLYGLPVNGKDKDEESQSLKSNACKSLSMSEEHTRHEHQKVDGERGMTREGRDEGREGKVASVVAKEEHGKESEEDRHTTEEDEEDIDDEGRKICPGSPSFKVYFTDNLDDDNNHNILDDSSNNTPQIVDKASHMDEPSPQDDGSNNMPPIVDKASPKVDGSDNMLEIVDKSSPKDLTTEEVKKEKKKRSFPKVIPRRGQAAVKHLLNIRSCCTSASSSHDRSHILTGKTPA